MTLKQRLAIFFDGTWNTEDDSTNVQHLHTLMREGQVDDGWIQRRLYMRGVGTGLLDQVSGGGFGFGLEANVREAYNWLVAHYNDGDEIYVFGFSRGAFTARSLVGFIATCGLVERGAQLTVNQLWTGYALIGRHREGRANWWEELVGTRKQPFRRITELKCDSGETKSAPRNTNEEILSESSRRVPIHYLGVFDTVGALGLDALAIPGIRGSMAQHHDPFPTIILKQCRHALAIDENRASFRLTPFLEYLPNEEKQAPARFDDLIEQRWFVGCHSNIGGGYPNNLLATRPLHWILDGARSAGLDTHDAVNTKIEPQASDRRDSFAEFVAPLWTHVIRAKRFYRPINRPILENNVYSLRSINETIDESVGELLNADPQYAPPGLIAQAKNSKTNDALSNVLATREKAQNSSDETDSVRASLVLWSTLGAVGFGSFVGIFFTQASFDWIAYSAIAVMLILIDRAEQWSNLHAAKNPDAIVSRVIRDMAHPWRLWGVVFFLLGTFCLLLQAWQMGWDTTFTDFKACLIGMLTKWYSVPIAATFAMLLLSAREKSRRSWILVRTSAILAFGVLGAMLLVAFISMSTQHLLVGVFQNLEDVTANAFTKSSQEPEIEPASGHLLLLQLLVFATYMSYRQSRALIGRKGANIGPLEKLQMAFTPSRVQHVLASWKGMLSRQWAADPEHSARNRLELLLRETIWRDMLGFIPVYTLLMIATLRLGTTNEEIYLDWLPNFAQGSIFGMPKWLWLIALSVVANVIGDWVVLRFARVRARPTILLVATGFLANTVKTLGYAVVILLSIAIYVEITVNVLSPNTGGWRWALANCTTYVIIAFFLAQILMAIRVRYANRPIAPDTLP